MDRRQFIAEMAKLGFVLLPGSARAAGFFDRGRYDSGLALDLDMGTRRVNWNHHRTAYYEFPQPRDLSAFTSLRVAVRTDRPREDASVTVWLAEENGSWYHLEDAVPLVDKANEALLRFDDFVLAEWVAPAGTSSCRPPTHRTTSRASSRSPSTRPR